MGCLSVLFNLIWILARGWVTALGFFVVGMSCYVTIIGILLGRPAFKMAAVVRWVWMSLATSQPRGPDRATLPIPVKPMRPSSSSFSGLQSVIWPNDSFGFGRTVGNMRISIDKGSFDQLL